MCGIIGEISKEIKQDIFLAMRDTLVHRGPDDCGLYINKAKSVALGHRRLSIIDLTSKGKQPMSNEDGTIWIVYNGEIYNYLKLKDELVKLDHKFKSESDTEVIIHGYEEWGINIINRLNGMFAFAIWDEKQNILLLARDRLGIKPLYYYNDDKRFIFASEVKAILKDKSIKRVLNPEGLKTFFTYGYIPSPLSIWNRISKLPPSHFLIYNNGVIKIQSYWKIRFSSKKKRISRVVKKISDLIKNSVKLRLVSDVPVGTLLSGGIDSSLITSICSEFNNSVKSFSIGFFPREYSELEYAKKVASFLEIENIHDLLSYKNLYDDLDDILYYYDEPFGVSSIFPTYLLMKIVKKNNYKVVLSGDGGDEIFVGYLWYEKFEKYRKYHMFKPLFTIILRFITKIFRNSTNRIITYVENKLKLHTLDEFSQFDQLGDFFFDYEEVKKLIGKPYLINNFNNNFKRQYGVNALDNIKKLQLLDIKTFLVDHILVKVDRASMANSIEVRVPFLDHNLIDFIFSLDHNLIYRNKVKKYLLRKVSKDYIPKEIIHRKKKGFSAPLGNLGFIKQYIQCLEESKAAEDGVINKSYLNYLISSENFIEKKIWILILFELWYRKWML